MSAPFDDDLPEEHAATGQLLADALESRADTVAERPGAWTRFEAEQARADRAGWRRAGVPLLAIAAAMVALVLIATSLTRGDKVDTSVPATDPTPTTDAPDAGRIDVAPTTVGTTAPPALDAAIRGADLRNATYPAAVCPGAQVGVSTGVIALTDGVGGDPATPPYGSGFGVRISDQPEAIAYGDVDGDGVEDAAVVLDCYPQGGDGSTAAIAIVTMKDGRVAALTTLVQSGIEFRTTFETVTDDRSGVVSQTSEPVPFGDARAVRLSPGTLVVTWWSSSFGGPQYTSTATYAVAGGTVTLSSRTEPAVVNPSPHDTIEADKYAIRKVDLRSMALPLAAGGVCPAELGPAGSVRDVRLVDGRAEVLSASGAAVGSVAVTDIRFGPTGATTLTYEDANGGSSSTHDDAIVLLRCEGPHGTRTAVLIVAMRDGQPTVVTQLFSEGPVGGSAVEARYVDEYNPRPYIGVWWTSILPDGSEHSFSNRFVWESGTFVRS